MQTLVLFALAAAALALVVRRARLSLAKHRSLAGHPRIAARIARMIPFYEYSEAGFTAVDGAPPEIAARRRAGFDRIAGDLRERSPVGLDATSSLAEHLADLQFTSRYRVPFQFRTVVRKHLPTPSLLAASEGAEVIDLDGNRFFDLTGSYGVNVFGHDFYKGCIERGAARVQALGPLPGALHPVVAENVRAICAISGQDEVSFHMSGTEAVMQAVRLARYHTRRTHVVRFVGAYHGWWGDVQPGVGNPLPAESTYTLGEMQERSLSLLRHRRDIACVLVNPLQALHPNRGAPADSALLDGSRRAGVDRAAYGQWLRRLREVCTERDIVLIFDEVFTGFRLAAGGAQEYFGVRADLVTYGKTLGGGLPVGVVCGPHRLMRRWRDDRPVDICFARGTFNAHPYVMGAMAEFLEALHREDIRSIYLEHDATWDRRAAELNGRLATAGLPLRIAHLGSIWTFCYLQAGCFHWMLQYYLRHEALLLSWTGSGRIIFSLDLPESAFQQIVSRIVAAAQQMNDDGWWWHSPQLTDRAIRRRVLKETLQARWSSRGSRNSPRIR